MPSEKLLAGWTDAGAEVLPVHVEGAAPHHARREARRTARISRPSSAASLARWAIRFGALLFQLPPSLKKDLARLDAFIDTLPPKAPAAFEFRHPSWFDAEVFGASERAGPSVVRGRQREAGNAARGDGRLRLLPPARRRVSAGRHRGVGAENRRTPRSLQGHLCVLQTRRAGASGRPLHAS